MESRSFIDTHIVVWLMAKELARLTPRARRAVEKGEELLCSPAVRLELQFLHEIGRIAYPADEVLLEAFRQMGIRIDEGPFARVTDEAVMLSWTRDPFDRLIVAHAALNDAPLVTKDRLIRQHYEPAVW